MVSLYLVPMTLQEIISPFSGFDGLAILFILIGWMGSTYLIENPPEKHPSVSKLMARYRREWMSQMVTRNPRIFDSQTLSSLRQGTSFFASASMIAIGGGLALIGNPEPLVDVASDLSLQSAPVIVWDIKILFIIVFLTNAFLKFVWSHRLFGYCYILMAAVPNDPEDPNALPLAQKAAEINIYAGRSYNRALRSVYFSLAASSWIFGAVPLMIAGLITLAVMYRREFASQSRRVLLQQD